MTDSPEAARPPIRLFLVFSEVTGPGYFSEALVYAHGAPEAVDMVAATLGQPFTDAYGTWAPLHPQGELLARRYDAKQPGLVMAWSHPTDAPTMATAIAPAVDGTVCPRTGARPAVGGDRWLCCSAMYPGPHYGQPPLSEPVLVPPVVRPEDAEYLGQMVRVVFEERTRKGDGSVEMDTKYIEGRLLYLTGSGECAVRAEDGEYVFGRPALRIEPLP